MTRDARAEPQIPEAGEWCVYLLECGDASLYVGITNDLAKRLRAHESGRGARYTRGRGPLVLRWVERAEDKSAALSREWAIRRQSRARKLALFSSDPAPRGTLGRRRDTGPGATPGR